MIRSSLLFFFFLAALMAQPSGLTVVGHTNTQALLYYVAPDTAPCTLADSLASNDLNAGMFAGANADTSRPSTVAQGRSRFVVLGARYRAQMDASGLYRSRALPAYTSDTLTVTCTGGSASVAFRTKNIPLGMTYSEAIPGDPAHPGNIAWPEYASFTRGETVVDPQTGLEIARATLPGDSSARQTGAAIGTPVNVAGGSGAWTLGSNYTFTGTGSTAESWLFIPTAVNGLVNSYAQAAASFDWETLHTTAGCSPACDVEYALTLDGLTAATPLQTLHLSTSGAVDFGDSSTSPVPILTGWGVSQAHPIDHVMASKAVAAGTFGILIRKKTAANDVITIAGSPVFDWGSSQEQQIGSSAAQDASFVCSDSLVEDVAGDGNWGRVCSFTPGNYWVSETNFGAAGSIKFLTAWGGRYPSVPNGSQCSGNTWDITNPAIQYCTVSAFSGRLQVWKFQYYGNFIDIPVGGSDGNGPYTDAYGILRGCNGGHTNTPCGDFTQLDYDIETECRAFNPTVSLMKTPAGEWFNAGHMGPSSNAIQLMKFAGQNGTGIYCLFDPSPSSGSAGIVAARNTWDLWPARYSGPHSIGDRRGPYVAMSIDGVTSGSLVQGDHTDVPGYGPYRVMLTGNMGALTACPNQPSESSITDWPAGMNVCVQVTVNGQPCDPSPSWTTALLITNGANATSGVSFGGGSESTGLMGATFTINGDATVYTLTGADTSGLFTVSPMIAAPHSGTGTTIVLEPADGGANCGNPNDFFLTAAQPKDIFFTNSDGPGGTGNPSRYNGGNSDFGDNAEIFRLLCFGAGCANGGPSTTWWLQSNYMGLPGGYTHSNWAAGQYLYTQSPVSLEGQSMDLQWNYAADPSATSETSNIINYRPPGGHSFSASIMAAGFTKIYGCGGVLGGSASPSSTPSPSVCDTCPRGSSAWPNWTGLGIGGECFSSRTGSPTYVGAPAYFQAYQPPFAGLIGCCRSGGTGSTDSHPGWYQASATPNEQRWYSMPVSFSGQDHITGSVNSPLTNVAGQLYKSSVANIASDRGCTNWAACLGYLHLSDQLRTLWATPLVDVSGPGSSIGTGSTDSFKMCTAFFPGECLAGSSAGDLFINGPNVTKAYCDEPAVAQNDADTRDICVSFNSTYLSGLGQQDASHTNMYGETSRNLGHLLTRNRVYSAFYNVRSTATGALGYGQTRFTNQMRDELLVWKIPPYPVVDSINRSDFISVPVQVTVPAGFGIDNVIAEFGYLEYGGQFYCSPNRQENCWKGNQPGNNWSWATEGPSGLPCSTTCSMTIPTLSDRILYYHILYRKGTVVALTGSPQVVATP